MQDQTRAADASPSAPTARSSSARARRRSPTWSPALQQMAGRRLRPADLCARRRPRALCGRGPGDGQRSRTSGFSQDRPDHRHRRPVVRRRTALQAGAGACAQEVLPASVPPCSDRSRLHAALVILLVVEFPRETHAGSCSRPVPVEHRLPGAARGRPGPARARGAAAADARAAASRNRSRQPARAAARAGAEASARAAARADADADAQAEAAEAASRSARPRTTIRCDLLKNLDICPAPPRHGRRPSAQRPPAHRPGQGRDQVATGPDVAALRRHDLAASGIRTAARPAPTRSRSACASTCAPTATSSARRRSTIRAPTIGPGSPPPTAQPARRRRPTIAACRRAAAPARRPRARSTSRSTNKPPALYDRPNFAASFDAKRRCDQPLGRHAEQIPPSPRAVARCRPAPWPSRWPAPPRAGPRRHRGRRQPGRSSAPADRHRRVRRRAVGADIAQVITADLRALGLFAPLDPATFPEKTLDVNVPADLRPLEGDQRPGARRRPVGDRRRRPAAASTSGCGTSSSRRRSAASALQLHRHARQLAHASRTRSPTRSMSG